MTIATIVVGNNMFATPFYQEYKVQTPLKTHSHIYCFVSNLAKRDSRLFLVPFHTALLPCIDRKNMFLFLIL